MMKVSDLKKALEEYKDDDYVIIGSSDDDVNGWCNIGEVKRESCCGVSIMPDHTMPFSDDN